MMPLLAPAPIDWEIVFLIGVGAEPER